MARVVNAESKARLSWRVQNVDQRTAEVDLFDVIGDPWDGVTAKDFIGELRSLDVDAIRLNINSPGGYIDDALAMYDAILNHPAEITAHVITAASAASFVMMAADKREIAKNGKVFIHDAQGIRIGDASSMRGFADLLDEESDNIASIYSERAGGTTAEWRARMQADGFGTSYRGQEAVDIGLIDEVATAPARNVTPLRSAARMTGRIAALMNQEPPTTLGASLASEVYEAVTDAVEEWIEEGTVTNDEAMGITGLLTDLLASLDSGLAGLGLADRSVPNDGDDEGMGGMMDLIPPLANGYKPPLPDDFTRLVAANLAVSREAS